MSTGFRKGVAKRAGSNRGHGIHVRNIVETPQAVGLRPESCRDEAGHENVQA